MKYTFTCPNEHGTYEVSKKLFEDSIDRRLRERLWEAEAERPVFKVEAVFKGPCPKCPSSTGNELIQLHIHRAKSQT